MNTSGSSENRILATVLFHSIFSDSVIKNTESENFLRKKSKKCLTLIRTSANMSLSAPLSEDEKSKKFKKLFKKCLTKFRTYDKMSSSTFKVAKTKSKTRHESFLSDRDNASLYYAEISRLI